MTVLQWDQPGTRRYEAGVDRGVIYWKASRPASAWNGLVSVDEQFDRETQSFYLDGVKYLEQQSMGDYSAQVKALSYPNEFNILDGVVLALPGVFLHDQLPTRFGFSYRTLTGSDTAGTTFGYKIHIVYDVLAIPDSRSNVTISDQTSLVELGWTFKATPQAISDSRPTAHVSIESWTIDPALLQIVEDKLYGTDITSPALPSLQELIDMATEFYET